MAVGDLNTAIVALQNIMAEDSIHASAWRDTLAMLYIESGKYPQAAQLAANVVRKDTTNRKYMEILARALQAGGKIQEATAYYERLRQMSGDPTYDYQVASMNFSAGKYEQSEAFITKIFNTPKIDTAHILLFSNDGSGQRVPLKAAALNLQGSLKARQKKIGEAQRSFEDAIRLDTAFTIAKQNLEALGK